MAMMRLVDVDKKIEEWKEILIQAKARVDSWTEVRQAMETQVAVPEKPRTPRKLKKAPKQQASPIVGIGDLVVGILAKMAKGRTFTSKEVSEQAKKELKLRGFRFPDKKVLARTQQVLYEVTHNRRMVDFKIVVTAQTEPGVKGRVLTVYRKE